MSISQHTQEEVKALIHRIEDSWDIAIHTQPKGSLSNHIYHCSDEEKDWIIMALRYRVAKGIGGDDAKSIRLEPGTYAGGSKTR